MLENIVENDKIEHRPVVEDIGKQTDFHIVSGIDGELRDIRRFDPQTVGATISHFVKKPSLGTPHFETRFPGQAQTAFEPIAKTGKIVTPQQFQTIDPTPSAGHQFGSPKYARRAMPDPAESLPHSAVTDDAMHCELPLRDRSPVIPSRGTYALPDRQAIWRQSETDGDLAGTTRIIRRFRRHGFRTISVTIYDFGDGRFR